MKNNIATEYIYSTFGLLGAIIITPFIPIIAIWICWEYTIPEYTAECKRGFKIIWGIEDEE